MNGNGKNRGGSIEIVHEVDGKWSVAVDGHPPEVVGTLEIALERAGRLMFARGESPGEWRVLYVNPEVVGPAPSRSAPSPLVLGASWHSPPGS